MKTIIFKILNDIKNILGKIFIHNPYHIYEYIINLLYNVKYRLEDIYYEHCLKPSLEKHIQNEKKLKNIIMILIIISHHNYQQKNTKMITYPKYDKLFC